MNYAPKNPRYTVSLGYDGSFIVRDNSARHNRHKRWLPIQFVSGQSGYDDRTALYPDYVHGKLWALHDARSRAQLERCTRSTNVTEGLHVTLSGRTVESHVALVEHVTL